ncbi:MAG: DUF192 domain-containing protein [Candidatus Pacearchaeota archaeon]
MCDTSIKKALGLMFHKKTNAAFIFCFNKSTSQIIHSFFVFFPLWLVFLDKNKKVISTRYLKPFQIFKLKQKGSYLLEFCEKPEVQEGDLLEWKNHKI